MEFVGRDADNGAYEESLVEVHRRHGGSGWFMGSAQWQITIAIVELLQLPDKATAVDNIMVEFIPASEGRKFGTGEFGKRMKVESIDAADQQV